MSQRVTPWWEVLKLRDEIVHASGSIDDVQMSLFQAVYGTVGDSATIRPSRLLRRNYPPEPDCSPT